MLGGIEKHVLQTACDLGSGCLLLKLVWHELIVLRAEALVVMEELE